MVVAMVGMSRTNKESGIMSPFAQGQSGDVLPYIVDVLGAMEKYTTIDETTGQMFNHHRLTTGPHPKYATGERVRGKIPSILDNATMPLLLDYVFGVEPSAAMAPPVQQQYAPPAPAPDPYTSAAPVAEATQ
jgi:hypothetical protein